MTRARAQSLIEYALLIAIVVVAFLGAQRLLRASVMGGWRETADAFGFGRQYEPRKTVIAAP